MKNFSNAVHIKVKNAGHEQAQWSSEVANEIIPAFLKGEKVESGTARYSSLKFIKLTGEATGHPSIK